MATPSSAMLDSCGTTLRGDSCAVSIKQDDSCASSTHGNLDCLPVLNSEAAAPTPTIKSYYLAPFRCSDWYMTFCVGFTFLVQASVYGLYTPIIPYQLASTGQQDIGILTGYMASAFAGGLCIASPITGYLSRRFKQKRTMLLAFTAFAASSDILLIATSGVASLVVARALQGVATAGIWTVATALLLDNVSMSRAGMLMACAMVLYSIGGIISQTLGGIMYSALGWKSVGFAGLGLCAANMIFLFTYLEKRQILASIGLPLDSKSAPATHEIRSISVLAQVKLLIHNSKLMVSLAVTGVYAFYISGVITTALSLRLAERYALTASQTSLAFLAISIPAAASGPFAGWLTDRFGARWALLICLSNYIVWLALACVDALPFAAFVVVLAGLGLAQGLVVTPILVYMAAADREAKIQLGSSVIYAAWNFLYAIAALIFPLAAGPLLQQLGVSQGWKVIVGTTAALMAVAFALVVRYITVIHLPAEVRLEPVDEKLTV